MFTLAAIPTALIAILVVVAIQVITALAKASAKKKQAQARQEQMRRPQVMVGGAPGSAPGPGHPQPMPGAALPKQTTVDELAIRRQAQLEQLRLRRETQRRGAVRTGISGQPTQTVKGRGTIAGPAPAQRPTFGGQQTSSTPVRDRVQAQPNRDLRDKQRAAEIRAAQERAAIEQAREVRVKRQAAERRRAEAIEEEAVEEPPSAVPRTSGDPNWAHDAAAFRSVLRGTLSRPESVRQLLVLKELLDPPVTLRQLQV